jgi:lipopolysaccharide export system permease protein
MKTVRRLLYRDIVGAVAYVALAFMSLFFFIDFVDELDDVGRQGYTTGHAAAHALLLQPGHFYELVPIAVLIGTIYALSRMAQASEFTILRTGGLGPGRALRLLAVLGVLFGLITFMVGDYVAPWSERQAVLLKARFSGGMKFGRAGAWLRDTPPGAQPARSVNVNVAGTAPGGELEGVRVFEFDADGRLLRRIAAEHGQVGRAAGDGPAWELDGARITDWGAASAPANAQVKHETRERLAWPSGLSANVVAAALLPVTTMTTVDLWRYTTHLAEQEQAAQRYAIQFWKKALYPMACLVMMALALPFAYLHARSGGISLRVFGGIMLGISFVLLNNVAGHLGLLRNWTPWLTAAMPSIIYLLMSMAAFTWLVRNR